jgi:hypothetical protein
MLPPDLRCAEQQALEALAAALRADSRGRFTVELRFEGLRLLPVVLRLSEGLLEEGSDPMLLFPDAGAAALARRDGAHLQERIADFRSHGRALQADPSAQAQAVLLAVAPGQADYGDFERLCADHRGAVVLINGGLEDAAVGIGSVARERRRGFLAQWQAAYALQPLEEAALLRRYPGDWELFRQDPEGFRLVARFDHRPDGEEQAAALPGGSGLVGAVDALIEGLRH